MRTAKSIVPVVTVLVSIVLVGIVAMRPLVQVAGAHDREDSGSLASAIKPGRPVAGTTVLLYFRAEGCPACARASDYLAELSRRYPELEIRDYEVSHDRGNLALYRRVAGDRGVAAGVVPAFFLDEHRWAGFSETVRREINGNG
ncbi:MAG: thioredoxin family protein [Spirochaetaceae bacterium]|nr:MAG: thioredoxin family protein [Spirochaetaceae bacterium]